MPDKSVNCSAGAEGWESVPATAMFNTLMTQGRLYVVPQTRVVVGQGERPWDLVVRLDLRLYYWYENGDLVT